VPTYQYACTECSHAFEQVQSFSDDALTVCPECQGRLRKLFSAVGVVFKGSGFYRTDSRASNGSSGSADGASSGSDATSGAKADSKTDSKPDTKSGTSDTTSTGSKSASASKTAAAASTS
jgi:putative FmdB family regulatory protein